MAWKTYRSRSPEYATFNLDALYALNRPCADFVGKFMHVCCSIDLMAMGFARRGLMTSNPCEQLHSAWVRERDLAVMDFCTATISKMASYQFRRQEVIQQCRDDGQLLVPKAIELHKAAIQVARTLKVFFDAETNSVLEANVMSCLTTHAPTWRVRILVPGVDGNGLENCLHCDCKFMVSTIRPVHASPVCSYLLSSNEGIRLPLCLSLGEFVNSIRTPANMNDNNIADVIIIQ